jgi:hypothetical protein
MFDAAEALLLGRGDEDAVAYQACGSVAVIGVKAEDDHVFVSVQEEWRELWLERNGLAGSGLIALFASKLPSNSGKEIIQSHPE